MNLQDLELPTPRKTFEDVLTDKQIRKLEYLNEDPELVDALQKVLLFVIHRCSALKKGKGVYDPGDNVLMSIGTNQFLKDEEVGQRVRANLMGVTMVKMGFDALKNFRKIEDNKGQEKNPAK